MSGLEEKPTPLSTTCPLCHEEGSLLVAMDATHYYRVTEIDEGYVEGTNTGSIEAADGADLRLFCSQCGQYFVVPDHYELIE